MKCISLITASDLVFADDYMCMDYTELGILHFGFSHLNLPSAYAKDEPFQVM